MVAVELPGETVIRVPREELIIYCDIPCLRNE
jgi:hypothetical protein